jgi:hypothetical protein
MTNRVSKGASPPFFNNLPAFTRKAAPQMKKAGSPRLSSSCNDNYFFLAFFGAFFAFFFAITNLLFRLPSDLILCHGEKKVQQISSS